MKAILAMSALFTGLMNGGAVLDRVAVVVGNRVVKTSDIERDLRVAQFLNQQPLDLSAETKRKSAARLVEQELIRQEILNGAYSTPTEQDVTNFISQIRQSRFGGADAKMRMALANYGLTPQEFQTQLRWQLTVLRFIDQRFRPGVLITDEDIQSYYQEHRAELQKATKGSDTLEALEPKIREILTGEKVNQMFEEWLDQVRRRARIEYRDQAFTDGMRQGASK